MTMLQSLIFILLSAGFALANTEAYGFQVPNYYDIPIHNPSLERESYPVFLNESMLLVKDHPILSIDSYGIENSVLTLPYNYTSKPKQRLFVKVNNYNNSAFSSNDLMHVKLCWPATTPIDFQISHRFIREKEFGESDSHTNDLNIYIVVDYGADFYAIKPVIQSSFDILLIISRLPNKVLIPIELYDVILYIVDIMILLTTVLPWIMDVFKATILSEC